MIHALNDISKDYALQTVNDLWMVANLTWLTRLSRKARDMSVHGHASEKFGYSTVHCSYIYQTIS